MWNGYSNINRVAKWVEDNLTSTPGILLVLNAWQREALSGGRRVFIGGRGCGKSVAMLTDAIYHAAHGAHVHVIAPSNSRTSALSSVAYVLCSGVASSAREDAIMFPGGGILDFWISRLPPGLNPSDIYMDELDSGQMEAVAHYVRLARNTWINRKGGCGHT